MIIKVSLALLLLVIVALCIASPRCRLTAASSVPPLLLGFYLDGTFIGPPVHAVTGGLADFVSYIA